MEAISAVSLYSCCVRGSIPEIPASLLGGKTRHVGPLKVSTEDSANDFTLNELFVQDLAVVYSMWAAFPLTVQEGSSAESRVYL